MTTRTTNTKGYGKPHKMEKPKPGIGSTLSNARNIATSQDGHKPKVGSGVPSTYFGNSRSIYGGKR